MKLICQYFKMKLGQLPQELIYKENKSTDDWVAMMINLDSMIIGSKLPIKTQDYMLDITCIAANEIMNQQEELEIKEDEIMRRLKKEHMEVVPICEVENILKEMLLGIKSTEVKSNERKPKTNANRNVPRIGN